MGDIKQEAIMRAVAMSVDDLTRAVARLEVIAERMERRQLATAYRSYANAHGPQPLSWTDWMMAGQPES